MKGMIFDAESVRAMLAGHKIQTRRVMKPQPREDDGALLKVGIGHPEVVDRHGEIQPGPPTFAARWDDFHVKPPHQPGDIVYVKEAAYIAAPLFADPGSDLHNRVDDQARPRCVSWAASMDSDSVRCAEEYGVKKCSPLMMPRWAARLFVRIDAVRAERVRDISEADARAEGCEWSDGSPEHGTGAHTEGPFDARDVYQHRWNEINAKRGHPWESNPWVWAYTFTMTTRPEEPQ